MILLIKGGVPLYLYIKNINTRLESDEGIAAANKEKIAKANKILGSYNIDTVNDKYIKYNETKLKIKDLEQKRERL